MALAEYKRKRRFERTPEPKAKLATNSGWSYVVQKHDASRLHYDFRLELNGVLKSWAVPKGPSLDPSVKRLAVHVEDHPVDYGDFEGVIPKGEYGGGTVLLWDRGTWEPIGDPNMSYRRGKLKFKLSGEKLHGGWMLVRSGSRSADDNQWLLIKERDEAARKEEAGDVLEDAPLSVASGRDLDAIAKGHSRVGASKTPSKRKAASKERERSSGRASKGQPSRADTSPSVSEIPGAKKSRLPAKVEVELATLTEKAPPGDQWLHEIKFDGYRMLCRINDDRVTFVSRNQQDWSSRLGPLVEAVKQLGLTQAMLDGEVVAMHADGTTDFQALQNAFREGHVDELQYYVFDLLYLNGYSLTDVPLEERKLLLAKLLPPERKSAKIHYSDHVSGAGTEFAQHACKLHLEGIVSKRRDRPYQSGRTLDWLKTKCVKHEEFVIGGFTEPTGSRSGFGALLVGYHDDQGQLRYAGKVGTGFDQKTLNSLREELGPLERKSSPFADLARRVGPVRTAHWVKPTLVAQIAYGSRTRDGRLRHASYQGLREDKPADEVVLERAVPTAAITKRSRSDKAAGSTGRKKRRGGASTPDQSRSSALLHDASREEFQGVRLTSPEKVLYPDDGITKLDLAKYYFETADWILPHVANRPLALVRCPEGRTKECFFQKHPGVGTPDNLRQVPVQEKSKSVKYVVVDDVDGLISLAQIGALEIHAWGSRADNLERPDRLVFDLDPDPNVDWPRVVAGAHQVRDFLQDLGLDSFVKTTGGKGLHLVVPIDRRHDWDEAKSFCKLVAETIVSAAPDQYTANLSKAARTNKVFIDYLRNGRGATAIVPYSTRARPGATVSAPLTWKELTPRTTSERFNLSNIRHRLASLRQDPWEGIEAVRQGLAQPLKKLRSLQRQ